MKKPFILLDRPGRAYPALICLAMLLLAFATVFFHSGDDLAASAAGGAVGNNITSLVRSLLG